MNQRLVDFFVVDTIIGEIMKMKPIPCRFEEKEEKLLRDEAARRGVTPSEFIRRMVAKGLMAVTLEETISDLRSFSANQTTGLTTDEFVFFATNILEVRNLLRIISAKNFPTAVTDAKRDAEEEVRRFFVDGDGNVG